MTNILVVFLLIIQIAYSLCFVKKINNRRIIINTPIGVSPIINNYDNNKLVLQNRITAITTVYSNNGDDIVPANPINSTPTKSLASYVSNNDNKKKIKKRDIIASFLYNNWLILGEVLVIYLAKQNPHFFKSGGSLRPEFWISKVGVFIIFFINGIALSISGSSDDLRKAGKTNAIILSYNFAFLPLFAKAFSQFYPDPAFRDGLLVLSVLPTTINICVAQTLAAGGNMGTAIFNAIFANVLGVFLTPVLAVTLLGTGGGVSLLSTLKQLGNVVITPLVIGQILRGTPIGTFAQKVSAYSRTLSSCLLLAIVYNVFSDTFVKGLGVSGSSLIRLCMIMPATYLFFSALFWEISKKLLPGLDAPTRAAALFASSQKTLAFGIPFIKTAFGHRGDIAYILAPLLMYAPAQLLLGSSIIVPAMRKLINKQSNFQDGGGI